MLLKDVERTDRGLLNVLSLYVREAAYDNHATLQSRQMVSGPRSEPSPFRMPVVLEVFHWQDPPYIAKPRYNEISCSPIFVAASESGSKSKYCITAYLFTDFHGRYVKVM
jgi:hypothetical protein